ncbi:MAG TPA: protein kinase [Chthonomonadaceae bacterium]|nr:protein kinase [Chthonomonadaceae bacterium]
MIAPDATIGPYTLLRSLGRGAFGEVWLAERRSSLLTTRVALKLPILAAADIEQIRREAQVWLQASGHPNIVPVLDAEVYDGQVVIASEYIAGGTLTAWLAKHGGAAPSVDAAASKTAAILSGLDYLHRAGLVHRDLKPDNVLLQDGAPRLADFGLARFAHAVSPAESIAGTPRYMAPEAFMGEFSAASDLWSAGVLFYEMLAGALPFPQTDIMDLLLATQSTEPAALPGGMPERFRILVTRLLAKSPADRFSSAAEALAELTAPVAQIAVAVPAAGIAEAAGHNLPAEPTSFIGRERELGEIRGLLDNARLLTLTGSGGCGKTRLALQTARSALANYPDGVWFVELAALTDPDLVPQTVANTLSVAETPGEPLIRTLVSALRSRRLLILLDNCEHLLSTCSVLADALLRACPDVRILASSREPMNIAGEQAYRVPSLALPEQDAITDADAIQQYAGVRLFVERARAAAPDFRVTPDNAQALAGICRRLDGIPLAIELAAARTRSLSVEQIADKLYDRFRMLTGGNRSALPRQQTLRSLIDWSYDLLTGLERALLRRLSVFSGGWTLEAAEAVCSGPSAALNSADRPDAPGRAGSARSAGSAGGVEHAAEFAAAADAEAIEDWEVLDLLAALGDKSLVVAESAGRETRYRLLETVRQYAADRAAESGESAALRAAHRDNYISLAEEAEPHFTRPEQGEWLARLDVEHDNLRAALDWCARDPAGVEPALRLTGALWRFWHTFGHLREGREQLARALERTSDAVRTAARAKVLNGLALLTWLQGDGAAARALYEQSVAIGRELGDRVSIAASLIGLGLVMLHEAEFERAESLFGETCTLCAEIGDRWGLGMSLNNLGLIASAHGDLARARTLHESSLAVRREMEDRWGEGMSLNNLGTLTAQEGDFAAARVYLAESLGIRRTIRDRAGIAYSLEGLAVLAAREGCLDRAVCLLGAEEALSKTMGAPLAASVDVEHGRLLEQIRRAAARPELAAAWRRGLAMTLDQAIEFALAE